MGTGFHGGFGDTKGSNKIHGFPKTVHSGKQGKHIPRHNNYVKGRSIFYGSVATAQELINKYAGTGTWLSPNKERVDFGHIIGAYVDRKTGTSCKTTIGIIHYSMTGAHIVPGKPKDWSGKK